jgi:hypothetical protein
MRAGKDVRSASSFLATRAAILTAISAAILAAILGSAACGGQSLESAAGGATIGGQSGSAGGAGGGGAASAPDYSHSPCYGQTASTMVYDGKTHQLNPVSATCRAEGTQARVYVADALFDANVSQAQVNGFMHRYELVGSARSYRPDLGALPTDELVFGDLPSAKLRDGKMDIFVIDTSGAGEGYLCSWCDTLALHMDGMLLDALDGDTSLAIASHESFHAIHHGYDMDETVWVDESMAEAAMTVNGYGDPAWLMSFLAKPNIDWGPGSNSIAKFNYGAGLVFGSYLWEQGGPDLMRAITQEPANGWAGIDAALVSTGHDKTGFQLFLDMAVALYLDDPARGWGFKSMDFNPPVLRATLAAGARSSGTIAPYGLIYEVLGDGVRSIRIDAGAAVSAQLVVADQDPVVVTPLVLGMDTPVASSSEVLVLTASSATQYTATAQ